jgi:glycosyltransferase involved in cell wall biosynthesis
MRLFYIANIRFPTERAHGIQVAHMCAAFARAGVDVTLFVPDRKTIADEPYAYYGVERNFRLVRIPVPDTVRFGKIGFLLESTLFAYRAARVCRAEPDALVYTREELPLLFLFRRAFYEAHQIRRSFFFMWLIHRARSIIAITGGLKDALIQTGIPAPSIFVAHDGYDSALFERKVSQAEARHHLGLVVPDEMKVAMYIGGFESWKGVETLLKVAEHLAQKNILTVIIGGTMEEIKAFEKQYPKAHFLGPRPYRELPVHQRAADILVVPNSAESELSRSFTSPLKLFAHMASGIPLAVSDVPAIWEVITERGKEAFSFAPGDTQDLARTLIKALSPGFHAECLRKAEAAQKRVLDFTWDKRAANILRNLL